MEKQLDRNYYSIDTSKTCHKCGQINHNLKVGQKEWQCPNPDCLHHQADNPVIRDPNASLNIRDWGVDPQKHVVLRQAKQYPYLQDIKLLVAYF